MSKLLTGAVYCSKVLTYVDFVGNSIIQTMKNGVCTLLLERVTSSIIAILDGETGRAETNT